LYCEKDWNSFIRDFDIRSLAFGPDDTLWVGTQRGLYQWEKPGGGECFVGQPLSSYTTINSGLPANMVTALAIKQNGEQLEIWIGTTSGLTCLHLN